MGVRVQVPFWVLTVVFFSLTWALAGVLFSLLSSLFILPAIFIYHYLTNHIMKHIVQEVLITAFFILGLYACLHAQPELKITQTPNQIGVSIIAPTHFYNGVELHPDSTILFWTCDPYQGSKDLFHQELMIGDTLWLPASNHFQGFALACYPIPLGYWKASFTDWSTNTWFQSSNNLNHITQEQPSIQFQVEQQDFTVSSNASTTRIMILSPVYGQVYYRNFQGIQGQNNTFAFNKQLPAGYYTAIIRGKYSNQCKEWVTIRRSFTVY